MTTIKSFQVDDSDVHLFFFENFDFSNCNVSLTNEEQERLSHFSNVERKREFIAVRLLTNKFLPLAKIKYRETRAPYCENGPAISISHTKGIAGIAYSNSKKIGFDIEFVNERIQRVKHKFLHQQEINEFDTENNVILTQIWSAKEALYKLFDEPGLIFAVDFQITQQQNGSWQALVHTITPPIHIPLHVFTEDTLVCVVAIEDL
jgi:4'-phosphopantetheinyl transferase